MHDGLQLKSANSGIFEMCNEETFKTHSEQVSNILHVYKNDFVLRRQFEKSTVMGGY